MTTKTLTTPRFSMPKIGLGTYKLTGADGTKAIENALHAGYKHIDTAQMYGNEKEVGQALKNSGKSKGEISVTTKIWPENFARLTEATEESLRNLQLDKVDLLLLHWPSKDLDTTKKGIDLLNEVIHKGYAQHVGVSNFNIELLQHTIGKAPVVCNQVEYHPYLSQETLKNFMHRNELALIAYQPLAHAKITDDAVLKQIAENHKKTVSQVALRWLTQQEGVAAIPKSGSKERQAENLEVFDFELTEGEMNKVYALNTSKHLVNASTAPEWNK